MSNIVERSETDAPTNQASAMVLMIERASTNPDVDIDKFERLLAARERITAQESQAAYNTAMSRAQSEMGRVSADATNPQTRSKYATYGKLDKVLRPIYTQHGFALSFDTGDGAPPDHVRVLCYVSHSDGHSRTHHADMPSDGKGAKGGDVMTKTHASGAAMSYGMRYLLKMIFNVAIGEEDNDGNGVSQPISQHQLADLMALAEEVGADVKAFCKYFRIEALNKLPASQFNRAVTALEKKRQGAK